MMDKKKTKLNSMLKFGTTFALALVFVVLLSFQVGCGKKDDKRLDMAYYSLSTSTFATLTNGADTTTNTTDFIGNTKVARQYTSITIKLSSEWLYKFYCEKFSFDLQFNMPVGFLEFDIVLTNLKNGTITPPRAVKATTYSLSCEQTANQPKTYYMKVSDTFEKLSEETVIIFTLRNPEVYTAFKDSQNFAYSISNFALYGEHKY